MKKFIKRFIPVLVLLLCLSCFCMTACGGGASTDYVITVVYPDGSAVNGQTDGTTGMTETKVQIQICAEGEQCLNPSDLGEDGKVSFPAEMVESLTGDQYKVQINGCPEGYTYELQYVSPSNRTITITLIAE